MSNINWSLMTGIQYPQVSVTETPAGNNWRTIGSTSKDLINGLVNIGMNAYDRNKRSQELGNADYSNLNDAEREMLDSARTKYIEEADRSGLESFANYLQKKDELAQSAIEKEISKQQAENDKRNLELSERRADMQDMEIYQSVLNNPSHYDEGQIQEAQIKLKHLKEKYNDGSSVEQPSEDSKTDDEKTLEQLHEKPTYTSTQIAKREAELLNDGLTKDEKEELLSMFPKDLSKESRTMNDLYNKIVQTKTVEQLDAERKQSLKESREAAQYSNDTAKGIESKNKKKEEKDRLKELEKGLANGKYPNNDEDRELLKKYGWKYDTDNVVWYK